MIERDFVDALIRTVQSFHQGVAIRPADSMTLGVPDVLAWIPVDQDEEAGVPTVWGIAMEAKQLRPLMPDPFHKGRRIGQMLKHPFTGPQMSLLRQLKLAGVEAFGIVRASTDTAFRIEPEDLPSETGNFTYEEMVKFGSLVSRNHKGFWEFWSNEVSGSRHRDNPGV